MTQYVEGVGLLPEDADQAMSTTALVAALMLTIPFSVMGRSVREGGGKPTECA